MSTKTTDLSLTEYSTFKYPAPLWQLRFFNFMKDTFTLDIMFYNFIVQISLKYRIY